MTYPAPPVMTPAVTALHRELPLPGEYHLQLHGRLVSLSKPVEAIAPAVLLRQSQGRERLYWRDGTTGLTIAGLGVAANLIAWGEARFSSIERQARALFSQAVVLGDNGGQATPRLFGGFAFRHNILLDNAWAGFSPAHFFLPHFQLVSHHHQAWLTINALLPPEEEVASSLPQLHNALAAGERMLFSASQAPQPKEPSFSGQVSYPMTYRQWEQMIQEALLRFRTTPLQKVVLSRVCEVRSPHLIDLDSALAYLDRMYPDCNCFLFEPTPHHAFFGATPELLVSMHGQDLSTIALAGSAPRGQTASEDERLATALLASAKDRHEHALVVDSLERRLRPHTEALQVPATPQVLKLSNIQHLFTPIRGRLRDLRGVLSFVELLHPTPALGGMPRELAGTFIQEAEPVPRGWYAGPIGWIDRHLEGSFAVAIRSAVAQGRRAWLHAGAGIVAGSHPRQEWEETQWKLRPIMESLGMKPTQGTEGQ